MPNLFSSATIEISPFVFGIKIRQLLISNPLAHNPASWIRNFVFVLEFVAQVLLSEISLEQTRSVCVRAAL